MRKMAVLAVGAVGLVGALSAAATPMRRPITQADTGKTFRLALGDHATLRLSNRWLWTTPRTRSSAVELTPVEYFVDPGFREWRVEGNARGKAIVRATGRPNCSSCTRGARTLRITFVVGAN